MNQASSTRRLRLLGGFTLVELLVSVALVSLITIILVSMTSSTAGIWRYTTGRIEQFRGADAAFEAITRRLSQATLNTYWDYDSPTAPKTYLRQSELRFITGRTETLLGTNTPRRPVSGIFFQAPLGSISDTTNFSGLDGLVNTCGYYVEYADDHLTRPAFLSSMPALFPPRNRYRLMELLQPSNLLSIYSFTSGQPGYSGREWFSQPISEVPPPVHVLAENVIALVFEPKLSKKDQAATGKVLSVDYTYDSTNPDKITDADINPKNQLPPIVQVTLVVIDESSANRLDVTGTRTAFDGTLDTLFLKAKDFDSDLLTLETTLSAAKPPVNFRVFTTGVSLRGAKWSRK